MSTRPGLEAFSDGFRAFLAQSPTSYHAAAAVAQRLRAAGFAQLDERDEWPQAPGRYVLVRDGAVVAWVVPAAAGPTSPLHVLGAHTDSPGFKLKPQPTHTRAGWTLAGVEVYGGPILNTWLDRDLGVAGRVFDRSGQAHLVRTGALARIANLAVHLDRSINDGVALDRQQHTEPILGASFDDPDLDLIDYLAVRAGFEPGEVTGHDLLLFDTQPSQLLGSKEQLLAAGRLDNLTSVYAGMAALAAVAGGARGQRLLVAPAADAAAPKTAPVIVFAAFDHEEVGSQTRTGAGGPLLEEVLERLQTALGATDEQRLRAQADSWLISADAGHLVHPNYAQRHDPEHQPQPGRGPLLKVNAQQRYATDGAGAALWSGLAQRAGVDVQTFVSNNSVPCGSTIGPIASTRLGLRTLDVGVGLLSMHSARELVHLGDLQAFSRIIAAFFVEGQE